MVVEKRFQYLTFYLELVFAGDIFIFPKDLDTFIQT